MNKSSALHEPARTWARRTSITVLAAATTLALVAPSAATAAPLPAGTVPATASAPLPVATPGEGEQVTEARKPKIKVTRSAKTQVKGETRVKLKVKVTLGGKAVKGKVKFTIGKKTLKTKTLKKGKASYKLPKSLKKGTKKIKVTYLPPSSTSTTGTTLKSTSKTVTVKVITQSQAIKREALKHVGVRYRGGGTSPRTGFDCSGFVQYVYKKAGIAKLPRSSSAQRHVGKVVSRKKAKVGDIIWTPGHVGIYLGGNKQIDAPRPGKTIQVREIWQKNPVFINL